MRYWRVRIGDKELDRCSGKSRIGIAGRSGGRGGGRVRGCGSRWRRGYRLEVGTL